MKSLWLTGALLLLAGGCSRHAPAPPAPKTAPAAPAEEEAPAQPANEATPRASPSARSAPKVAKPAPAPTPATTGELTVGMSREEVLDRLGVCAHLVTMVPGGAGARSVEVYEPKPDRGDCVKRFGERQFMVVAGKLDSFIEGLNRAPRPHAPPPGGGHHM